MPSKKVVYRPAGNLGELEEILRLQRANLAEALSDKEREAEGFVTLRHTLAQLRTMQEACPQVVAMRGSELLGYALCLHPGLAAHVPALAPMFERIEAEWGPGSDYRVMGQICIAKTARRQGHFRGLYQCLREQCTPLPIITEVAEHNIRSMEAHLAIGFRELARRREGGTDWRVIIWP